MVLLNMNSNVELVTRKGQGYTVTKKGYRRITAGPDRHQYAHRVKARECMKASGLVLTDDYEVHHICENKTCDEDFHLLILPGVLHDMNWKKHKRRHY